MIDQDAIDEEMNIAEERAVERRKSLDQLLIEQPIRRLNPRQPAVTLAVGAGVDEAIAAMKERRVGNVLITENDKLVGIITERDIVRKAAGSAVEASCLRVEDVMTPNPERLRLSDPIVFALNKMGVGEFRHIPLVDEQGRPVGSLSVRHIVRFLVDFFGHRVFTLPPEPGQAPRSREGE